MGVVEACDSKESVLDSQVASSWSCCTLRVPLQDGRTALFNSLSGALDVVDSPAADLDTPQRLPRNQRRILAGRGHVWDSRTAESAVLASLAQRLRDEARDLQPLKLVLIPSYRCNLKCDYCWQQPYIKGLRRHAFEEGKLAALLRALDLLHERFGKETPWTEVQLFGGEPLLGRHADVITAALDHARTRGWRVSVTTNGMGIVEYMPVFRNMPPAELQVTVDGDPKLQEVRRRGSKFGRIAAGIDQLLFFGHTYVKLRVNLDLENLGGLVDLANVLIDRKWFTNPSFMAYLAPTRDHSFDSRRLFDERVDLLRHYLEQRDAHPQLEIFQMRGWPGYGQLRTLSESGYLPPPLFQSCDANRNMLVLDPQGYIFACNETNGDPSLAVGTFWPRISLDAEKLRTWRQPVANTREPCAKCPVLPYCGGGCALASTDSQYFQGHCMAVRRSFEFAIREYVSGGELL